ncbi:hypothetical protein POTOM_055803 [Populus tomentosa]|uniref:Uncharacterized protein n=1 Tax=Populus tomentosa TaxID=118781 RepID=A0A8X7XYQ6_POPTO|nr:hypothetical protein POTOM_055803 [Populus tomentosa]
MLEEDLENDELSVGDGDGDVFVKSLAAELFLDRAVVLDLLRDTPLNLVVMSAALPDEPAPTLVMLETIPIEIVPEETGNVDVTGTEVKVPIHVMQGSWFARKRLKKVHVDTPYSVYRRTRRPTVSLVFSTFFLVKDIAFCVL